MRHAVRTLIAILLVANVGAGADELIFRSGDELIIQIRDLDLLQQANKQLSANIRLAGEGGQKQWTLDLADRFTPPAIVIDLTGYGACAGVLVEVAGDAGKLVYSQRCVPVPLVNISSEVPLSKGLFAAIEPGSQLAQVGKPQIALPDVVNLRKELLSAPARVVTTEQITFPVLTDTDLPALASSNYVIVSRQSFAPSDPSRCSLYFSYRKPIYDTATAKLKQWRKLLVEVPLQRAWLDQQGDAVVTLPLDGFAVHTTEERERASTRWNSPEGYNMLGESSSGLAQGGQCADTDDEGRIYISNVADGAGLVRFNPHTARFEQPPVNFLAECRKFLPKDEWSRNWDADFAQIVCTRGRVFVVFNRNYRVNTPNGKFETCSGVVSAPQDAWNDAEAFRRDIRLHAGCWSGAPARLYEDDVAVGGSRALGNPIATTHGIAFGTWRLDLDSQGNTERLVSIGKLSDSVAVDGTVIPSTIQVKVDGLPKQRIINVGSAGRQFLRFTYGELQISRAALALTLPGAPADQLVDARGEYRSTFPAAPTGTVTVRFDIASKIKSEPSRYGLLAESLTGISQGPTYAVTAIPGEADQAIGVCEYSYYYSRLDFSRRGSERTVFKSYLPLLSNGQKTGLPLNVGLGPYNATWIEHDNALWLYMMGYTGLCRLKYAEGGQPLEAFQSESFQSRLIPQPVDDVSRDSVKDYLHLLPAIDGRLINIGRGRPGRGGGAYSAGLELFDPRTLGKSQTAVAMTRCYGLFTPVSRLVLSATNAPARQEIFVASGKIRPEYLEDLADPALRPANQDPKVFAYDCISGGALRDLYGFALPVLAGRDSSSNLVVSPCHQYLVMLQAGGALHTYHVTQRRFVDGMQLCGSGGEAVEVLEFARPTATLWTAPNRQIFLFATHDGGQSNRASFFEVFVSSQGKLSVRPHLAVSWNNTGRLKDVSGVVRGFLPDLTRHDGSYDLVLGGDQQLSPPTVRIIDDFVPPRTR